MKPYQKHIKDIAKSNEEKRDIALCGEVLYAFDWVFQDIDHAVHNSMQEGRLQSCPKCSKVVIEALKS